MQLEFFGVLRYSRQLGTDCTECSNYCLQMNLGNSVVVKISMQIINIYIVSRGQGLSTDICMTVKWTIKKRQFKLLILRIRLKYKSYKIMPDKLCFSAVYCDIFRCSFSSTSSYSSSKGSIRFASANLIASKHFYIIVTKKLS